MISKILRVINNNVGRGNLAETHLLYVYTPKEGTQLMSIYIPYFYIIQDKRNGIYYAGSKYGKDSNPVNFMVKGGYTTSSNKINKIIEECGISVFLIRKVRVFKTRVEAQNYETRFLQKVDARNHPRFYNGHNNDGNYFNEEYRKERMIKKYGVDHPMKCPELKEKAIINNRKNMKEKYGVTYNFAIPSVRIQIIKTNNERYGVDHYSQTEEWKQKASETYMSKYGVKWVFQSEEVKEKSMQTSIERYGSLYYSQTEDCKEKLRESVYLQFQDKEKKEKHRLACIKNNSSRGKIWINDGNKNKRVTAELFESVFYFEGWIKGRLFDRETAFWNYDKLGENNPFYGKKHTDETKRKISKSKRKL